MLLKKIDLRKNLKFAITAFLIMAGPNTQSVFAQSPCQRWLPIVSNPYVGIAYPETNARYWVFKFLNSEVEPVELTLSAQFPYARYLGYTLYSLNDDDSEGNPIVYNDKVQHLEAGKIQPLDGHRNPYVDGVSRYVNNRSYQIHIVDQSSRRILPNGKPLANTLVIPSDQKAVALFLRVYLPDNPNDIQGGVALPLITAINELTGEKLPCPDRAEFSLTIGDIRVGSQYNREAIRLPNDEIFTYRPGHYGFFPNGDSPYLVTPLLPPELNEEKVAVLRFKAPRFANTRAGKIFKRSDQVSYWSVCMGDWLLTTTSQCIADEEAKVDQNGYVNIVVGPQELAESAPGKWNYIAWGGFTNPILLFRQISPKKTFDNSFSQAKIAFDEKSGEIDLQYILNYEPEKIASADIMEYAPRGKYCTIDQFLINGCFF